jgi:hypothetical protein
MVGMSITARLQNGITPFSQVKLGFFFFFFVSSSSAEVGQFSSKSLPLKAMGAILNNGSGT